MNRRAFLRVSAFSVVVASLPGVVAGCGGGGSNGSSRQQDDNLLLFRSNRLNSRLTIARPDGTIVRALPESLRVGSDGFVTWSRDHRRIAFLRRGSAIGIGTTSVVCVRDADGSNLREVAQASRIVEIDLSPDGNRVLFSQGESGSFPFSLREHDLTTNTTRTLNTDSGGDYIASPVYAPDGRTIFFGLRTGSQERQGLYRLESGATARQVLPASGIEGIDVSPNGRTIVFDSSGVGLESPFRDPSRLFRLNADGSRLERLPPGTDEIGTRYTKPTFSPDGTRLAFLRADSEFRLFISRADGTNAREVEALRGFDIFDWR